MLVMKIKVVMKVMMVVVMKVLIVKNMVMTKIKGRICVACQNFKRVREMTTLLTYHMWRSLQKLALTMALSGTKEFRNNSFNVPLVLAFS